MVASQCLCFGRTLRPGSSKTWAVILFIACWVTFCTAEACLLAGALKNAYHTKYTTFLSNNPPPCNTLRKGVFAAAAALIVLTGIFSELYFVTYSKADVGYQPNADTGITMENYY